MKKLILLLMLVCFTASFIACGKNEDIVDSSKDVDVQSDNNEVNDKTSDNEDVVEKVDESNTDIITEEMYFYTGIYYDYPSDKKFHERTLTANIICKNKADEDIVIVLSHNDHGDDTFSDYVAFDGTLDDVIDYASEDILHAIQSEAAYWAFETMEVNSTEKVSMAGYDSIKFTATTANASIDDVQWDCYMYGYAFVINDLPYTVVGVVTTKQQEQSMIDEMIADVDAIAGSIRTEE